MDNLNANLNGLDNNLPLPEKKKKNAKIIHLFSLLYQLSKYLQAVLWRRLE